VLFRSLFQRRGGSVKTVDAPLGVVGLTESVIGNTDRDIAVQTTFPQPCYPLDQPVSFEGVGGKINVGYMVVFVKHLNDFGKVFPQCRLAARKPQASDVPCRFRDFFYFVKGKVIGFFRHIIGIKTLHTFRVAFSGGKQKY
jgi:hypothetical protein